MTTEQHNDAPEAPNEATAASTAQQTALPKPDRPGKWRVTWSNGDIEAVKVWRSKARDTDGVWFFRSGKTGKIYPVREGWLGRWEAL